MADDPYEVLGVARTASPQQVAEAYRALAQIYHPDRYAEAPPRVQEEAQRRMQALNAAYEVIGKPTQKGAPRQPPPPRPRASERPQPPPRQRQRQEPGQQRRPRTQPLQPVLYVDGSKHHHHATVAPLGLDLHADPVRPAVAATRCPQLDEELSGWFQRQTRNASMTDKLMFAAWTEEQRALYTATIGCSEVLLDSVEPFTSPCRACSSGG